MILWVLCIISKPLMNSDWSYSPETLYSGKKWRCLCTVWPWQMDRTIHRAAWSQLKKTRPIWGIDSCDRPSNISQVGFKSTIFWPQMIFKFDGWLQKTIGRLFYATSSFVHHFIAISEFKLVLQSRNAPFESKLVIFCPVWPWNLMDDLEKQ